MNLQHLSTQQRISAGAMLVVFISAFLPWVSIFGISVIGVEGDGILTLILSIAGLVTLALTTGIFGKEAKVQAAWAQILAIALGALAVIVMLVHLNGFSTIGAYLSLLGSLGWLGGSIWQAVESKPFSSSSHPTSPPVPGNAPHSPFPPQAHMPPPAPGQAPHGVQPPRPHTPPPPPPAPGQFTPPPPPSQHPPQEPGDPNNPNVGY